MIKKIFAFILLSLLIHLTANAQNRRVVLAQMYVNQFDVGYSQNIINQKFVAGIYAGIANCDINPAFDDFTTTLDVGIVVYQNTKNRLSINTGVGIYLTNNNYYLVKVPLLLAGTNYARFFGKTQRHCFLVSLGYRYGKKSYKQQYLSDILNAYSISTFKVSPLMFSVGYGYTLKN